VGARTAYAELQGAQAAQEVAGEAFDRSGPLLEPAAVDLLASVGDFVL
jgi:hypothetical protein